MAATEYELATAIDAVSAASAMCADAQGRLVAGDTLTKGDDSPVTVADFAAQAVVAAVLTDRLGELDLVGEEDPTDLAGDEQASLREGVTSLVNGQLAIDAGEASVLACGFRDQRQIFYNHRRLRGRDTGGSSWSIPVPLECRE